MTHVFILFCFNLVEIFLDERSNEIRIHAARESKKRSRKEEQVRRHQVDGFINQPPHNPCWTKPVKAIWNLRLKLPLQMEQLGTS